MATAPVFAATPHTGIAVLSTLNTSRDGTGTIVALFTPGASGSRVTQTRFTATVTSTAQLVRIYRSVDSGTTWKLWQEVGMIAVTIATGVPGATSTASFIDASGQPITIASTDRIGAAAETANNIVAVTEYSDL